MTTGSDYEDYLDRLNKAATPFMMESLRLHQEYLSMLEKASPLRHFLQESEPVVYAGPDLFDVAPPGVHALLAYRNVHRFTGVLDGTPLAVKE